LNCADIENCRLTAKHVRLAAIARQSGLYLFDVKPLWPVSGAKRHTPARLSEKGREAFFDILMQ
jgi:hypothetical protein